MSNFICPTCGLNNIDCGKQGYKTDRELELERRLQIAIKALEFARDNYPMRSLNKLEIGQALLEIKG